MARRGYSIPVAGPSKATRRHVDLMDDKLESQIESLKGVLRHSPAIRGVIERAGSLRLPDWYLGAGRISQTVWNHISGRELTSCIGDLDLVYFDPNDVTYAAENLHGSQKLRLCLTTGRPGWTSRTRPGSTCGVISASAIGSSPTDRSRTLSSRGPLQPRAVGVRYGHGKVTVYAPYGLADLLGMVVRPNKVQVTKKVYLEEAKRWTRGWPDLQIVAMVS